MADMGVAYVVSPVGIAWLARRCSSGNAFANQHRALVPQIASENRDDAVRSVNAVESPLAWMRARKDLNGAALISEPEFLAGERLREDFTFALMTPKVSASWPLERIDCSRRVGASPLHESDRVNAARKRFWAALDAAGAELAPILIGVCCHLEGLETIEKRFGLPARSGKTVLKLALTALARHYGLLRKDRQREAIRARSSGELPCE
jgi:hypothetical protein